MGPTFLPEDSVCSYSSLPRGGSAHEGEHKARFPFVDNFMIYYQGERTELEKMESNGKTCQISLYMKNGSNVFTTWNSNVWQSFSSGGKCILKQAWSLLAVLAGAVEASVEETDPLLQVVSVLSHHPVSHHLLLLNQTLKFVAFESL